ncbi:3-oxoacyl-[acyl-carrier protein] reductase [Rhodoglobus vestalii]|uniref:3-oxoacyl-[acyl-carrier protein] reductase n=1 Tax=Rhodoglobus vestalii TaxID=193384 RepID=A0A8H2PTX6_9MICO|nr:SDR family NAD(P)-dependent oxidoreductase [Rhodoglobus vestalii]TQO19821.1 3-oxoacyl-[acyl-carrier protein] reductase [Rhodoglobus vestalii]
MQMKKAIVTGGVSGIGEASAARLRADGVEVITVDISSSADYPLNVSDSGAVDSAVAAIGHIDILINCAGVLGPIKPLVELTNDEFQKTFDVNINGIFYFCRATIPSMVDHGWGRVINIASLSGKNGTPNLAAYSASKAAVSALTKSLGKEIATTGVLVNAIAPGFISTPMNADTSDDVIDDLTSEVPMKRSGRVEEVAALVSWLASDECSFSTGAVYDISGGTATY